MVFVAQVNVTGGAFATVNEAVQVTGPWQVLVTVQVTVVLPPHLLGALPPLFDILDIQPPVNEALFNQFEYALSIAA